MALRVSLVNLQKLTLWPWLAPASMRIFAPAQNTPFLARSQHHDLHLGMLELQTLDRISEFYIDTEIVGVEFEFVTLEQAAPLIHIQGQGCRIAVGGQPPVPVSIRMGFEIDGHVAPRSSAKRWASLPPRGVISSTKLHQYAKFVILMIYNA